LSPRRLVRRFWALCAIRLLASVVDLAGIAALLMIMSAVLSPDMGGRMAAWWPDGGADTYGTKVWTLMLLLACLLFFAAKNLFTYWVQSAGILLGEEVGQYLSGRQMEAFFARGYAYFQHQLVFKITFGTASLPFDFTSFVLKSVFALVGESAVLLVFIGVAVAANPLLGSMLTVATVPLTWQLYRKMGRKALAFGTKKNTLIPKSNDQMYKLFENYVETKVYNGFAQFRDQALRTLRAVNRARLDQQRMAFVPKKALEMVAVALIVVLYVAHAFVLGSQEAGSLVFDLGLLGMYGYKVMPAIGQVLDALIQIKHYSPSMDDMWVNLQVPQKERNDRAIPFERVLRLQDIGLRMGNKQLFDGLDFELPKGKITALTGPSGVGKSTLAKLLMGLLAPDRGRVWADGQEVQLAHNEGWLHKFAYLGPETQMLYAGVYENTCYSLRTAGKEDRIQRALLRARLGHLENREVGEHGKLLSTGERQRLGLARALYHEREILVLDEFSANLDNENERAIMETLLGLNRDLGLTILLITHKDNLLQMAHAHVALGA
jgi:ABC-type multidrug transport system fused ATPase/permease subunit